MAVVQLRNQTKGRACYDARRAGGLLSMMAMRALKRRLSTSLARVLDKLTPAEQEAFLKAMDLLETELHQQDTGARDAP